jgi:hypothetical protein
MHDRREVLSRLEVLHGKLEREGAYARANTVWLAMELIKAEEPKDAKPDHPTAVRYVSPCPAGYETVLGYLSKTDPEALDLMDQDAEATARDGWKLTYLAKRKGLKVVKVRACQHLEAQGIFEVNAYPEVLLRERFG